MGKSIELQEDEEAQAEGILLCESHEPGMLVEISEVELPSEEIIYKATRIFSALADSTRFKILVSLANGELCVCDLQELCGVSQSAVSHQLRLLKDIDLVRARRVGQRAYYRLSDDHVTNLLQVGVEHASE